MSSDNDTSSFAGTKKPFFPWTTVSRQPATSVVIMTLPIAIASNTAFGIPSLYEGNTKTSACDK